MCQNSMYMVLSYSQTAVFMLPGQSSTQVHVVKDMMVKRWLLNTHIYTSYLTIIKRTVRGISEPFPKDILRTRLPPMTS